VVPLTIALLLLKTGLARNHLKDLIERSSVWTKSLPGLPETFSLKDPINLSTVPNLPGLVVINRKDLKLDALTQTKAQSRGLREARSQAILLSARKDTLRSPSLPSATSVQTPPPHVSYRLQPLPLTL
jgi:hypothetical protein